MSARPRDPYFLSLQAALRAAGIAWPTVVVDRARLDDNVTVLASTLPSGMALRLVAKSLPSAPLLAWVAGRVATDRFMTFNASMVVALAAALPDSQQLLGKPLPVAAVTAVLSGAGSSAGPMGAATLGRIQWLVDTPERVRQYAALADERDAHLRLAVELDVGLHRGGFVAGDAFRAALRLVADHPRLAFAGFMGYEPHVVHLPRAWGLRDRALQDAWRAYGRALEQASEVFGVDQVRQSTRNAGGSPTHLAYDDTSVANEVAVGSVLVKPSDFDQPALAAYRPAAFVATPVLKAWDGVRVPGMGRLDPLASRLPGRGRTVFLHGGNWLADVVDPPGMATNPVFGRSSNQELLNAPRGTDLRPDDMVFLRPTQSESLFLQFGDLTIVEDGRVVDTWPVLPPSA